MSSALSTSEGSRGVGGRAASYQLSALLAMQRWRQRQREGEKVEEKAAAASPSALGEDGLDVLMREHDEQMAAARSTSSGSPTPQQNFHGSSPSKGDVSAVSTAHTASASSEVGGSDVAAGLAPKPRTILEAMEGFRKALEARPPPPPKALRPPRKRSSSEQVGW